MNEHTSFLYPFIDSDERDSTALLEDLALSAREKAATSNRYRIETLAACAPTLDAAANDIAERLQRGKRMFMFGNGGSSTDATSLADLFARPAAGRPVAARTLVDDSAVLTALANDVGFDLVFSRQLIAYSHAGDIALGLSTSGNSQNLLNAFATAVDRGLLTIAFAGYGGGEMAASEHVNHCFVVASDSVHRIQETQAAIGFELWRRVQFRLDAGRHAEPGPGPRAGWASGPEDEAATAPMTAGAIASTTEQAVQRAR